MNVNGLRGLLIREQTAARVGAFLLVCATAGCAAPSKEASNLPRLIAHAGGVVDQRVETNSLEALNESVRNGHTMIEVDLSWTADDRLVLIHDWDDAVRNLFEQTPQIMTSAEFRSSSTTCGVTQLTLDDLAGWMNRNPAVTVVTDIKARNIEALRIISANWPDLRRRFIPQIYHPETFEAVRELGFDRVIFTLYRGEFSDRLVIDFAMNRPLWAVTMTSQRAVTGSLAEQLSALGVVVFAHTVNDHWTADRLRQRGVYGVYTDWLSPADRNRSAPLPDWQQVSYGTAPLDRGIFPFVPWDMDGLAAKVEFRSVRGSDRTIRLNVRDPDGSVLKTTEVTVDDSGRADLDLRQFAIGHRGHGWIEYDPSGDIQADIEWTYRDVSKGFWSGSNTSITRFDTFGPGSGVAGVLVAVVNPTETALTYQLTRSIGGRVVNIEHVDVRSRAGMLRVYRSRSEESMSLSVSGGPMVVQVVRWDPLGRFLG
jgi:glycerophosphoryl diester phosphodiesterase